jgi:hypothetical protein
VGIQKKMAEILKDDFFGVCPTCLKAEGCNIGRENWVYCAAHRVKWRVGENLFSGWRYEAEERWFENYLLLKDFPESEPHSPYPNNPGNEALQPCACERCIAPVLTATSLAAKAN